MIPIERMIDRVRKILKDPIEFAKKDLNREKILNEATNFFDSYQNRGLFFRIICC